MSRFEPKVRWWTATTRSLSRFAPARRPHARRRLNLECLEDRTMLSIIALTVDSTADASPPPGVTTLREAITQADADTANQYAINFSVEGTIDLTSPLPALDNNIDIEGPGASVLTVQRDQNAVGFSIFTVNSGETVNLSGVTITGGSNNGGLDANVGGGIFNDGILTVSDSTFAGNFAEFRGGGIFNQSGAKAIVSDSTFNNNMVIGSSLTSPFAQPGGGIENEGTLTVNDSIFIGNTAEFGGGIDNGGVLTVNGSVFANNSATWQGGGIENEGTLTVNDSIFTGNSATIAFGEGTLFGDGGGIFNSGTLTVINDIFTNNTADIVGGGIFNLGDMVTVTNSTFTDNSANDDGSGIFNDSVLMVNGSVFTDDTGGAIASGVPASGVDFNGSGAQLTVDRDIFADNSFPNGENGEGGGILNGGTLTVLDSVFIGNSALASSFQDFLY